MEGQATNGEDSNTSSKFRPSNQLPTSSTSSSFSTPLTVSIQEISFPTLPHRYRRSLPSPLSPIVGSAEFSAVSEYTGPFYILGRCGMSLPQLSHFLKKWATTYFAAHQVFIDYFAHLQLSLTKLDGLMKAMHGILQDKQNYEHQHLKHYIPSYQTAWVNGCELLPSLHNILADSEASVYVNLKRFQQRTGRDQHHVASAGQYIDMDDANTRSAAESFFHAFINNPAMEKFGEGLDKLLLYAERKVEMGVALLAEESRETSPEGW